MQREKSCLVRWMIMIMIGLCCIVMNATADVWYTENEWNFLDTAMETDQGIPEDADGVLARIKRKGILRVAMAFDSRPMNYLKTTAEGNDSYAGVDMALARKIAERMGVELVIVPMQPIYVLPALTEDLCDLTISAVSYTPGTALYYTLSQGYVYPAEEPEFFPHEKGDIGILIRQGESVQRLEDLENRIIVAQSESIQEAFAANQIKNYMEFRRVASARPVFDMVQDGAAYAGIVSISMADTFFQRNPDYGLCLAENQNGILRFSPDVQFLGYRVAAKKGETKLIAFVNGVIREARETGEMAEWLREAAEDQDAGTGI